MIAGIPIGIPQGNHFQGTLVPMGACGGEGKPPRHCSHHQSDKFFIPTRPSLILKLTMAKDRVVMVCTNLKIAAEEELKRHTIALKFCAQGKMSRDLVASLDRCGPCVTDKVPGDVLC
jgi:hypothetical protein